MTIFFNLEVFFIPHPERKQSAVFWGSRTHAGITNQESFPHESELLYSQNQKNNSPMVKSLVPLQGARLDPWLGN